MTFIQLRLYLDKNAKDCGRTDTAEGVFSHLLAMYGMSSSEAREHLYGLRREPSESYLLLGNRVKKLCRLAYGGLGEEAETQLALEHFDRAIGDPALR